MSAAQLRLVTPEQVAEFVRSGGLRTALGDIAGLADAELSFQAWPSGADAGETFLGHTLELPIQYRGQPYGRVFCDGCGDGNGSPLARAARAMTGLLEHMLDREMAVSDLAEAMITSYEELSLLYTLLPAISTKIHPGEIGEVLVEETARTLNCRRVSLLVLDEKRENLRLLASRGLPPEVRDVCIPVANTVAGRVLLEEDLIIVNDLADRPDLAALSNGRYQTASFALVRVPLAARGEPVGVLTATERNSNAEFSTRDRKLLDGLSAMGASALLNCRLHEMASRQMMGTIRALAFAVDAKDQYTHDHSGRVAHLCVATTRELGISDPATCREVELAGLLHDIGKIGVPDAILSKRGGLTPAEYAVVRTHVEIGFAIVQQVQGLEAVARGIFHHHERYDGLGYPSGLSGDAIPLSSKLIAVSDVFDTLTSDRPYRKGTSKEAALRELIRCKGTQLDPAVVDAFVAVIRREGPSGHAVPTSDAEAQRYEAFSRTMKRG